MYYHNALSVFLIQLEWAHHNNFYYRDLVTMNQAARRNYVFVIKN